MSLKKFLNTQRGVTERYQGEIECHKPASETYSFVKSYHEKGTFNNTKLEIVREETMGTTKMLEKVSRNLGGNITEIFVFRVKFRGDFVERINIEITSWDPKEEFDIFQNELNSKIPNVTGDSQRSEPTVTYVAQPDFSEKTLTECITAFSEHLENFKLSPIDSTFITVNSVKKSIETKINALDASMQAGFTQSMSQINLFMNALEMQFSNPIMAAQAPSFVGIYVGQMAPFVTQMLAEAKKIAPINTTCEDIGSASTNDFETPADTIEEVSTINEPIIDENPAPIQDEYTATIENLQTPEVAQNTHVPLVQNTVNNQAPQNTYVPPVQNTVNNQVTQNTNVPPVQNTVNTQVPQNTYVPPVQNIMNYQAPSNNGAKNRFVLEKKRKNAPTPPQNTYTPPVQNTANTQVPQSTYVPPVQNTMNYQAPSNNGAKNGFVLEKKRKNAPTPPQNTYTPPVQNTANTQVPQSTYVPPVQNMAHSQTPENNYITTEQNTYNSYPSQNRAKTTIPNKNENHPFPTIGLILSFITLGLTFMALLDPSNALLLLLDISGLFFVYFILKLGCAITALVLSILGLKYKTTPLAIIALILSIIATIFSLI